MLLIQHLHLFLSEFASKPFKSLDESPIINYSFILHIEKLEAPLSFVALIFFDVGFLANFFVDSYFHFSEPINSNSVIDESIAMNQIVDKELLPLYRDTTIHIQIIFFEFVFIDVFAICGSS